MNIGLILLYTAIVGCSIALDSKHAKNKKYTINNGTSIKARHCIVGAGTEIAIGQRFIKYPKKNNDEECVDCLCGPGAHPKNCTTKRCMTPPEESRCVLVKDGPYCCMNVCEFWSQSKPIHIDPSQLGSPVLKPETSEEIDKRLKELVPTRKPGNPETLFYKGLRYHRWLWTNDKRPQVNITL